MEIFNPPLLGEFPWYLAKPNLSLSCPLISTYDFIEIVTIVFCLKCFDFWLILCSHLAQSPLSELPLEEKFYQRENH